MENVKDPVCGMSVNPNNALKATYGDRDFYFCSDVCQQAFINDPLKYVDKSKSAASLEGTPVIDASGHETTRS